MSASSNARNDLRSKILSQQVKSSIVVLDDGVEVEVRQSSVGAMLEAVAESDLKRRMALMIMTSCFVPGTNERLFEESDFDVLMTMPSGGYYQKLIDAINRDSLPQALDEAKKL